MNMTKRQLKSALGLETDADLARSVGISKQAIGKWGDDDPIPEKQYWKFMAGGADAFCAAPQSEALQKAS